MARPIIEKCLRELAKPAAKRAIGGDRDPIGITALVAPFTLEEAREHAVALLSAQLPAKVDCYTCRFHDRQWAGDPCTSCLDGYQSFHPYPKWRRAEEFA